MLAPLAPITLIAGGAIKAQVIAPAAAAGEVGAELQLLLAAEVALHVLHLVLEDAAEGHAAWRGPGCHELHQVVARAVGLQQAAGHHPGELVRSHPLHVLRPHQQGARGALSAANQQYATIVRPRAAVVPSGEDAHHKTVMHQLVALPSLLVLVRADDQVNPFALAEGLRDVPAKRLHERVVLCAVTGMHAEGLNRVLAIGHQRIRPEGVVNHDARCTGNILQPARSLHRPHLVQGPISLPEAPVQHQDAAVNASRKGQPIKRVVEGFERLLGGATRKVLHACPVEAKGSLERRLDVLPPVFVVPPVQPDARRVHDLEGEQQHDDLKLVATPVNPIAIEHVGHLSGEVDAGHAAHEARGQPAV
mmetsp:Transcript_123662/g.344221  ORF Transcript_123662/g.344221 Transcript_123662/m.344221 type:complete len:363 (+) Transcript_123662:245-1333(+)